MNHHLWNDWAYERGFFLYVEKHLVGCLDDIY